MSNYSNETCASIQDERLKILNDQPVRRGQYVLYWMQSSQRIEFNHALEYAVLKANRLSLPLIVFFGLTADFPEGNARHYCFMLQGLKEVQSTLKNHRILMVIQTISPPVGIIALAKKAAAVIVDRVYLRLQRDWRREAALKLNCSLIQIESDAVVPVEAASNKEEFSAATFRPKINKPLAKYLKPVVENEVKLSSLGMDFNSLNLDDPDGILHGLKIPGQTNPVTSFLGGTSQAMFHLNNFLIDGLQRYAKERNNPLLKAQSDLSPYLHFGQISPLYVALEALKTSGSG